MSQPFSLIGLLLLIAACLGGPARAGGSLAVAPVTLEFKPGARAFSTEVSNPGDEAVTVQVRLFAWRTDQDGDHYEPSQDIGFSPPIFRLAPGAKQTLRLALLTPAPRQRESAYRLYVDQLPVAEATGIQLPVRLVLPVFVPPVGAQKTRSSPRPPLDWSARRSESGEIVLVAANRGGRRAKLYELTSREADGQLTSIRSGLAGYVLAGESRSWTFKPGATTGQIDISARDDEGEFHATVAVAP